MAAAAELQMATAAAALQEMIELAWAGGEASIVVEEGILRRSAKMHLQLKVPYPLPLLHARQPCRPRSHCRRRVTHRLVPATHCPRASNCPRASRIQSRQRPP